MAMANKLGIKYREGLVKNRYIGRTFIMASQQKRQRSVRHKLNPIPLEFEGKDVLLGRRFDRARHHARGRSCAWRARPERGRSSCLVLAAAAVPLPLRHRHVHEERVHRARQAGGRGRRGDRRRLRSYQTLENLIQAVQEGNPSSRGFCTACFSGEYPTGDITPEVLRGIEQERLASQGVSPPAARRRCYA
jgi:amidophosphoribosyltransferase